ncbi:MAG: efflux RND transporter periplasmic adaptor subunit [Bacteroidales bacterium]
MNRVILFITLMFFIFSCSSIEQKQESTDKPLARVKTGVITRDTISVPVISVGTLASKTQSNLSFLTGGIIADYYVNEGDIVKEDQLLAKLDMTEIQSRTKQASLALEKARRDFRRAQNLYQDTVITLEQYQNAETALEVAQENYQIARFNRKNSEIRAPSEGKILKKLKEKSEIAAPGHPVLVFASTEAEWILKVNLSDRDIVRVNTGDSALIRFDAYPGENFNAVISEIATAANPLSGTYEVELKLLNLPDRLVTGLIGSATILPQFQEALFLPPEGLVEAIGSKAVVFVMREGKSFRKEVEISTVTEKGIIVKSGLNEGDTIITDGNAWLHDREEVMIVN